MSGGSDLREPVLQHLTGGLVADVQVDLGGGNAAVAQVFLDVAQLHPLFHQQRGEGVAEHVRRDAALDAGIRRKSVDGPTGSLGRKGPSGIAYEQIIGRFLRQGTRLLLQIFQIVQINFSYIYITLHKSLQLFACYVAFPFFSTLSKYQNSLTCGVQISHAYIAELLDSQTCTQKQLQQQAAAAGIQNISKIL